MAETRSKILNNDRPAVVGRKLARKIGIDEALVLQTLHYEALDTEEQGQEPRKAAYMRHQYYHEGFWWVVGTYDQFSKHRFDFINPRALRRVIERLEAASLVISEAITQDGGRASGKRYRVNHTVLEEIATDKRAIWGQSEEAQPPCQQGELELIEGDALDAAENGTVPEMAAYPAENGSVSSVDAAENGTVPCRNRQPQPLIFQPERICVGESGDSSTTERHKAAENGSVVVDLLIKAGIWPEDAAEFAARYSELEIRDYIESNSYVPAADAAAMLASRLRHGRGIPKAYRQAKRYTAAVPAPVAEGVLKPEIAAWVTRMTSKADGK